MSPYDWNQHKDVVDNDSKFARWNNKGDLLEGVIEDITSTTFSKIEDGKTVEDGPYPTLHVKRDDGRMTLCTCSQMKLLEAVVAESPEIGDRIRIKYLGKYGATNMKMFDVEVRRTENVTAAPAAAPPTPVAATTNEFDGPPF